MTKKTNVNSPTKMMFADEDDPQPVKVDPATSLLNQIAENGDEAKLHEPVGTPAMEFELPSAGQFGYPAMVRHRDILSKDEEILASATPETYAGILNSVLKSVMNDCSFFEDMIVSDRDFAMIYIWANNYDAIKKMEIECGKCSHKGITTVDLTKLDITYPKKTLKGKPFDGSFELVLKNTGQPVKVNLSRVKDELAAENLMKKTKDFSYEFIVMALTIEPPSKLMDIHQRIAWVQNNVTGKEMGIIRKFHQTMNFGVHTKLGHKCSACGEVTPFPLPFSVEDILYPSVQYDFEE